MGDKLQVGTYGLNWSSKCRLPSLLAPLKRGDKLYGLSRGGACLQLQQLWGETEGLDFAGHAALD